MLSSVAFCRKPKSAKRPHYAPILQICEKTLYSHVTGTFIPPLQFIAGWKSRLAALARQAHNPAERDHCLTTCSYHFFYHFNCYLLQGGAVR